MSTTKGKKPFEIKENTEGTSMTNTSITTGVKVQAHTGTCSMGTMFIYEAFRNGEIIKVNEKSIRVKLDSERRTTNGKTTSERALNTTATFRFWKNRSDNGKALYKNAEFGIITL
jgi:hypothetical protein